MVGSILAHGGRVNQDNRRRTALWVPLFFLVFSLSGGGCATEAKYGKVVDQWIGKSSDRLFWEWGYPDKQITAPDGNTVYIYHKSRTLNFSQTYATAPEYYNSFGGGNAIETYTNSNIQKLTCTTWFEIGRRNKTIRKVVFKGDLCVAGGLGSGDPIPPTKSSQKR